MPLAEADVLSAITATGTGTLFGAGFSTFGPRRSQARTLVLRTTNG